MHSGIYTPNAKVASSQILCRRAIIRDNMRLLRYIAAGFINFFSITQPPPEAENRAAIYIAIMLAAVLAFVVTVISIAAHVLRK
jgi:hypothetical protein